MDTSTQALDGIEPNPIKRVGRVLSVDLNDPACGIDPATLTFDDILRPIFWRDCAHLFEPHDRIHIVGPAQSFDVNLKVVESLPDGLSVRVITEEPLETMPRIFGFGRRFTADPEISIEQARDLHFIGTHIWLTGAAPQPGHIIEIASATHRWYGEAYITAADDENEIIRFQWLFLRDLAVAELR